MKSRAVFGTQVVPDVAVDDDHLWSAMYFVLDGGRSPHLSWDRLVLAVGLVGDDEGQRFERLTTSVWTLRFPNASAR